MGNVDGLRWASHVYAFGVILKMMNSPENLRPYYEK